MCNDCVYFSECAQRARAARLVLLSGDLKDMTARVNKQVENCELFVSRYRRRYA